MSINWDNLSDEGSEASEEEGGVVGVGVTEEAKPAETKKTAIDWNKLSESESDDDFDEEDDPDGRDSDESADAAARKAAEETKARLWAALMQEERDAEQEKLEAEKRKQELRDRLAHGAAASAPSGLVVSPRKEGASSSSKGRFTKGSRKGKSSGDKSSSSSSLTSDSSSHRRSRLFGGHRDSSDSVSRQALGSSGERATTTTTTTTTTKSSSLATSMINECNASATDVCLPDYLVSFVLDDWMKAHNNQRPKRVIKQGWLEKTGPVGRSFQRRWTVLNEDKCEYYKHFGDVEPRGCFEVGAIRDVAPSPSNSLEFRIAVPDREFRFLAVSEPERAEWVRFFEIAKRAQHEKTVYQRVDPPSASQNQLILDIEIQSMSQKKTIRMDGSYTAAQAQDFCVKKFPHIPNLSGLELFVIKYQKFATEMLAPTEPVGNILTNRDRLDLRKKLN